MLAGSETTGTALLGCIYHLCKTPSVMERLVSEIRTAFTSDQDITFSKAENLQYLNAVIEESLRIYPPVVVGLPRIVPKGGASMAGHYVPENVSGRPCVASPFRITPAFGYLETSFIDSLNPDRRI